MSLLFKPIQDRKLRIALVGCGRISEKHLGAINKLNKDLSLVAVCDVDLVKAEQVARKFNCKAYSNYNSLIGAEQIDCVILCTPSGLHAGQAIAAARQGIHIMSEKPMATKYLDALKMINECDSAGVQLFTVKQNRLNPTVKLLKKAVLEKRFGKIVMVQANVFWTRHQEYYSHGSGWRGTWEFDGGALMNQAIHYFDLLHWLIGPVDCVQAMTSTTRDIEAEDTGVVNLRWRNGALGSVSVTMLTYPQNLEGSIMIIGEKGTVKLGGIALNEVEIWNFDGSSKKDHQINNVNYDTNSVYGDGHLSYYQNFVDVLRGTSDPVSDGRNGIKSLELVTAAYRSARDRSTVGIPLGV